MPDLGKVVAWCDRVNKRLLLKGPSGARVNDVPKLQALQEY